VSKENAVNWGGVKNEKQLVWGGKSKQNAMMRGEKEGLRKFLIKGEGEQKEALLPWKVRGLTGKI